MASKRPYDSRTEAAPGQSRNGHFTDAAHQAAFAAVIKSRSTDQDNLTFGLEAHGDD